MANFPKIKIGLTFSDPEYNYVVVHMDQHTSSTIVESNTMRKYLR